MEFFLICKDVMASVVCIPTKVIEVQPTVRVYAYKSYVYKTCVFIGTYIYIYICKYRYTHISLNLPSFKSYASRD